MSSPRTLPIDPFSPASVIQDRSGTKHGDPTWNQAAKIISKFGGEAAMASLMGISRITVYKWQYRKPEGRDGLIPSPAVPVINRIAAQQGIRLTPHDWLPERIQYLAAGVKDNRESLLS